MPRSVAATPAARDRARAPPTFPRVRERRSRPTLLRVDVVLVHPEIPHNSGCAARLSAATGVRLHLVEPLGFSLEDRYLKRAGLDYWPMVDLVVHASWRSALLHLARGGDRPIAERLRLFTARGGTSLFETAFAPDDVLVFGSESRGLPAEILDLHAARRVYIPIRRGIRSLNLANVVCLSLYTAMVRAGMPLSDNDGTYEAHPQAADDVRPAARVRRGDGALERSTNVDA
jgi:tRNA (cytidine/uridine-2'-O-)-methyltransferase